MSPSVKDGGFPTVKSGKLLFTLAAILFLAAVSPAQTPNSPTRAITPEDVLSIRELYEVALSPDGKRIAFAVTEPNDPARPREPRVSNVWVVPADGSEPPRPLIPGLKNAATPNWSPDGRALAFLSDHEGNGTQVYLLREGETKAARLTDAPGGVERYELSPDGKMMAFLAPEPAAPEEQATKAAGDDAVVVDRNQKYSRLWVTNLSGGKAAQVTKQDFEIRELAWSPAGDELVLVTNTPNPRRIGPSNLSLVVVNRSTGEVARTLGTSPCSVNGLLTWSPDGRWVTFYDCPPNNEKLDLTLALAPARGGAVRPLLKDYAGTVLSLGWTPDSKSLLAQSIEGTHEVIGRIDAATGRLHKITDIIQSQWGASFSTNGETVAYLAQTPESANDVWVMQNGATPRRLTDFNPQTKSWRFGKVSEVVWKNSKDGLTRKGVLITPPDYQEGRLYPTVVNTHPGDTAWWTGFHASKWWDWGQLLASYGYVVFLPNTRGVTGEGGAMHATNSHWGGMAYQDLMDGVDHLIGLRIADPNRLGIGGWSNGGFITEFTITRTTRFKAAVAQAGHSNLFSLYGTSYLRDGLRNSSGASPYFNREWYDEHSPITLIKNCRTPTLLLHGEFDPGVPLGQAHEFYTGLKDAGVEAQLVIYPRERHSIQEYWHRIDLQRRVLAWFDRHLK